MLTVMPTDALGQVPTAKTAGAAVSSIEGLLSDLALAPAEEFTAPGVSSPTRIHIPELEGNPFGRFQIELSIDDARGIDAHVNEIIFAIDRAGLDARKLLHKHDAKPPPVEGAPYVKDFVRKAKNLILVYRQKVVHPEPRVSGVVIAGGLFVAALAVGAMVYARTQEEKGR